MISPSDTLSNLLQLSLYFRAEIEAAKKDIFTIDNSRQKDSSLYFTPNKELDMGPVSFNPDQDDRVNPNVSYSNFFLISSWKYFGIKKNLG